MASKLKGREILERKNWTWSSVMCGEGVRHPTTPTSIFRIVTCFNLFLVDHYFGI